VTSTTQPARARPEVPWAPLLMAVGATLIGAGGLLLAGHITIWSVLAAMVVVLIGCALIAVHRRESRLGWANGVTLARLVGVSWIAAITGSWLSVRPTRAGTAVLIVVAVLCLVLDGIDGKVARARGEASDFGARFDMETDAAMIMVLCLAVALQGSVGWWVVVIGLARYAYWLASLHVPALNLPVAPSLLRKVVAVSQSAALLICLAMGLSGRAPGWLPSAIAGVALAGLIWSFVSVTVWQLRAARSADPARPGAS
jgi:phosphatidylglycerophosphate synthase